MDEATRSVIAFQPPRVARLLSDLAEVDGFSFVSLSEQFQVYWNGLHVGGWNKNKRHFYFL